MATLTLNPPVATLPATGAPPPLERPLTVAMAPARFPDGTPLDQAQTGKAGVLIYRTAKAGATEEVWNDGDQRWQAPLADLAPLKPTPFTFKAGAPEPWQAMVVAAGLKDAAGNDRFAKSVGGFPRYHARAYVEAVQSGQSYVGISDPSADWTFASEGDQTRFQVDLFGDSPKTASKARLQIKSGGLVPGAYVEIRAMNGNEVEIARCDGAGVPVASIVIGGSGDIHIKPAAGHRVFIDADLECGSINYRPFGTNVRTDL